MNCPICGKRTEREFRPFCSGRCKDIDLGKWVSGDYAIPAIEDEYDEDEHAPAHPADDHDPAH